MGWLKRITGIDSQQRAMKANAAATIAAAEQSSRDAANAALDQARSANDQMQQQVVRDAAIDKANDLLDVPMETADVQIEAQQAASASAIKRKKRGTFGTDYMSGVSI